LSIVRFRAAIKDPLDVGFLFWSVAVGITCGAGLYMFSLTGTLFIALVYIILQLLRGRARTYLLVIRADANAAEAVNACLKQAHAHVRSRTTGGDAVEITASVFIWFNINRDIDSRVAAINGVNNCMLVEYTGDI
jgi:uncharacterized membrane protein YhiD involved in acid resistance